MDKTLTDALARAELVGLTDRELAAVVEAATAARRDAAESGMVLMTRPGLPGQPVHVAAESVEYYESLGLQREQQPEPEGGDGLPKGNASREEWAAYALAHGLTADEVEPHLTRDEIRDHFQNEETPV